MPQNSKKASLSPLGMSMKHLVNSKTGILDLEIDTKNIFAQTFKKVILGGAKDYKIDVTIKKKNIERLGGLGFIADTSIKDGTVIKSKLLEMVTLRDRRLLEDLETHAVNAKVTEKSLSASLKHLYSDPYTNESSKLNLFLSFD
jgi:hypothetical protein